MINPERIKYYDTITFKADGKKTTTELYKYNATGICVSREEMLMVSIEPKGEMKKNKQAIDEIAAHFGIDVDKADKFEKNTGMSKIYYYVQEYPAYNGKANLIQ